ncbi:enoyl-CoA hydratase/isomerase family protein [Mycolicibacterium baixiangningiae]|uniref:enoyl-CoA hydratase/isomerase family protein n=1 Tax=Mycolicibacterium baixiangningiae TaxID=2761578 RepID=UPI0018D195D8|nr:enoyl-CoA hydratase/isomerase family protein [Mycolicibacterium baixiangningiae]
MPRAVDLDLTTLSLTQHGRVLTAVFADPPHHFLSLRLVKDMDRLTIAADSDPTVGAVVLTGTGDKFVSHSEPEQVRLFFEMSPPPLPDRVVRWSIRMNNATLKIPALRTLTEKRGGDWGSGIVYSALLKRTNLRMNRSGVVYVAAINGAALGGGFELALSCDLRLAADDDRVRIGLIEILAGLIPGGGGTRRLSDIMGSARAFEHMVEGEPLTAPQAQALGLVHRISPPNDLLDDARHTAERLSRRSPYAVAALKRAVYFNGSRSLSAAFDAELAAFISTGRNPGKRAIADAFEADVDRLGDSPFVTDIKPWLDGSRLRRKASPSRAG